MVSVMARLREPKRAPRVASLKEERTMTSEKLRIVDGPDKPGLQWSVTKPGEYNVHFHVEGDAFDAQIERMDECSDGFTFELRGQLTSGELKDRTFEAIYSIESRSGWMKVH
jgi:hypothetical protein